MRKRFGLLSAMLLLTACSVFSPVKIDPANTYVVNSIPDISVKAKHRGTLLVAMPTTSSIYSTSQMVYSINPYQISYFGKNIWAETPAEMLQFLMVQTIQNSHYFNLVSTSSLTNRINFVLNTQLLEFKQDFSTRPSMFRLKLRAQFLNVSSDKIVSKEITVVEPAPYDTPYGGVLAANQAVRKALVKLLSLF